MKINEFFANKTQALAANNNVVNQSTSNTSVASGKSRDQNMHKTMAVNNENSTDSAYNDNASASAEMNSNLNSGENSNENSLDPQQLQQLRNSLVKDAVATATAMVVTNDDLAENPLNHIGLDGVRKRSRKPKVKTNVSANQIAETIMSNLISLQNSKFKI